MRISDWSSDVCSSDLRPAQEADQQHEDDAERQFPRSPEPQRSLQEVAQVEPHGGADQRTEQRAEAADHRLHDKLARGIEGEGFGRHVALQRSEEHTSELKSLMRLSDAVFCLTKKKYNN